MTESEQKSDEEFELSHKKRMIKMWRKQRPDIEPVYDSDTSDEEATNTIGNVPLEWYNDMPHIGYDKDGNQILKSASSNDQLDSFLSQMDQASMRTVLNKLEGKDVQLTREEMEIIERICKNQFPIASFDPYPVNLYSYKFIHIV